MHAALLLAATAAAADPYTRQEDVIYGRKYGVALTMDVFRPTGPANGAGVAFMVSGGFFSDKLAINPAFVRPFAARGYVVFAVVHGSQPKFTIPEIVPDVERAVRFIRHKAADFGVDPKRLGVTGGSAGGHLSLMLGSAGPGKPDSRDPVDKESARVNAVACLFPPTDFLNYGTPGTVALGDGILSGFKAPFDFAELDPMTRAFVPLTGDKRLAMGKQVSPVYRVTKESAPTLILHGDADKLVPVQQAELIIAKLKEAGVPAELVVKKGAGHGWPGMEKDLDSFADWFDKQMPK